MLIPDTNRATSRPGTDSQVRNSTPETRLTAMAAASIRRRPAQSDRCPASSRLTATPAAYTAKITVSVSEPNPSRAWYSTYSGVGMAENAMVTANA